ALYYVCSMAYDSAAGVLYYTTHNSSSWRDLRKVDVRTGESEELINNGRIGDLAFNRNDRSLWGVQHHNGYSTVVRMSPPYTTWREILPLKYGKDLYDIDISPDGQLLTASMIEVSGAQRLIAMKTDSLLAGSFPYDVLYEFDNNSSPMNFGFSNDGKYLYGTSYYTGVSNVARINPSTKEIEWLSNVETGLFRPVEYPGDSLLAFRYTGKGFLPVVIPRTVREDISPIVYLGNAIIEKYPELEAWKIPPPSVVKIDSLTVASGEYEGWDHLALASAYPIVEGYKDYTGVGARVNLQDPLGISTINLTGSYTPSPGIPAAERFHASVEFRSWQWRVSGSYNGADFYDLFGPTRTSRKGYAAGIRYTDFLIFERPTTLEYTIAANIYTGLERLPDYQNVAASFDKFATLNGRLTYASFRRSLGAVDDETGIGASLNSLNTLVRSEFIPRAYAAGNAGIALPIDHSSLWLRAAAGWGGGARDDVFGGFFFGGFGNNWVDSKEPKRYREYYSFPGVPLNSIGGTTFVKATGEWTLPPVRFREFGIPSFYCTWMRSALFSSALVTNLDAQELRTAALCGGVQVDFKLVLFSHLDSILSFGYALAAEEHARFTREFMVSLKLL
ncbi:MAG: hypothetical protein AB1428_10265, partial [Bacteroidota bacterium]